MILKGKAVYWLAADYCNKAKKADPSCEQKANELLTNYKSNFPSVEDTFFRSLKEGDPYRLDCWINESTTVKKVNECTHVSRDSDFIFITYSLDGFDPFHPIFSLNFLI